MSRRPTESTVNAGDGIRLLIKWSDAPSIKSSSLEKEMQRSIGTRFHRELGSDETANTLVVGVERQQVWKTLESPIRMRLLELIRRLGSCTILELAEAAGTNPVNLYYHVRALESAELIEPVGHREGVARRAPVIYAATHDEIVIEFDPDDPDAMDKVETLQRSWLREASENQARSDAPHHEDSEYAIRWEYLDLREREELSELMGRIVELLDAKRDANVTRPEPDQRMVVVSMRMAECAPGQLPTPRVNIRPVRKGDSLQGDLADKRQRVAQTA